MTEPTKIRTEIIISIVAVVIAFISLWFSISQGVETRRHNRLSVKPILVIGSNTAPAPDYGLILSNEGTGPALVKGWKITYKNKLMGEYQEGKKGLDNWYNIEKGWLKIREQLGISSKLIACGDHYVYRSGQRSPIFWVTETDWKNNLSEPDRQRFTEALEQIQVEIDYESIYGEPFKCIFEIKKPG
jgi:hypothetical protein